jgi:NAD(P)-dependent dehydrogenase (short-subunit alcohol dehydrogenase family)
MAQARRSTDTEVALVWGGGDGIGKALALALGARGVAVVVAGVDERSLGRVVGEVVCGGGKARHVAGKAGDSRLLSAAIEKAREAFGELTLAVMVSSHPHEIATALGPTLRQQLAADARVLVVHDASIAGGPRSLLDVGCDEIFELGPAPDDDSSRRPLDLALFLLFSERGAASRTVLIA